MALRIIRLGIVFFSVVSIDIVHWEEGPSTVYYSVPKLDINVAASFQVVYSESWNQRFDLKVLRK